MVLVLICTTNGVHEQFMSQLSDLLAGCQPGVSTMLCELRFECHPCELEIGFWLLNHVLVQHLESRFIRSASMTRTARCGACQEVDTLIKSSPRYYLTICRSFLVMSNLTRS